MELINATRMNASHAAGLEPSGRELLVVVIKGTFVLPRAGETVRLHDEQRPLTLADTFTAAPGLSAPMHESDFAPSKPACDVLLHGSAHAPDGRLVDRMRVGLRVGRLSKGFDVIGDRHWRAGLTGIHASPVQPFTRMPISYDHAFGGVDQRSADPAEHAAYALNPAGRGWHKHLRREWVDQQPLPNLEAAGNPVRAPDGKYLPVSLGPVARGWPQRSIFAGTYDQQWRDDVFPFLPADFDTRYHHSAPADQQIAFPEGPLDVTLQGFTPDGTRQFVLPNFEAPVCVFPKQGPRENLRANLDTIVFEPDQGRFTMTWRVARPLRKNMHEIAQVLVGRKGREWWQRRDEIAFPVPVVMIPMPEATPIFVEVAR